MNITVGLIGIAVLIVLLVIRIPVAVALVAVSFGGVAWMVGLQPALGIMSSAPYDFAASWTMSAIPMFLLMGFISYHTGLTAGLFNAAKAVLARIPGGLAISTVMACGGFATVCGSSIACGAAMGRIAIPQMVDARYNANFASGAVAAGGTLGALIPPSIIMILYGVLAETSVTQVFLGGIVVGIMTAIGYSVLILLLATFRPDIVPSGAPDEKISPMQALLGVWPVLALIVILFGGLFSGLFTATEAGAAGAAGAILISALGRNLTWQAMRDALLETMTTTASIFILSVGAVMFTRFLGLSGAGSLITSMFEGWDLSFLGMMLLIIAVYLVLGMFMEPFGAMMITLPIFIPILNSAGVSLVWFGVLLTKLLEIGMITPPFGMNVFVIKDVASRYVTLSGVFKGVAGFLVMDFIVVAAVLAWPEGILWLPTLMK